jgi:Helix-turn-helix domain
MQVNGDDMKTENQHSPAEADLAKSRPEDFEPLLDCREAAERVHCHEKTLQRYARRGLVPAYHIHHRWYFRASELDLWVRSQVHSPCYPCRTN